MTLILDAAVLVAAADTNDRMQPVVETLLRSEQGPLVVPAPVTAEVDYLLAARLGEAARLSFMDDLAAGRFAVECLVPADYPTIAALERRYANIAPGLADLSIVALAHRLDTTRIATFDRRHFDTLRTLAGERFTIVPAPA
jgi:hypothetical protein